jgi:uncharacterized protein YhfF
VRAYERRVATCARSVDERLPGDPPGGGVTPPADLRQAEFAFPGPLRDRLVAAILAGDKTSTTGLHEEYVREGTPIGAVGDRELVVDSDGRGVAVIETTAVEVKRIADVDLSFAIDEGGGFETLDDWRDAHVRFFTSPEMSEVLGGPPVPIDDDTLVVCIRFRVVERIDPSPGPPA